MLVSFPQTSNFQFLLRQAFADDGASIRLLQNFLFLLLSTASLMFIPCAVKNLCTLPSLPFFPFPLQSSPFLLPVIYSYQHTVSLAKFCPGLSSEQCTIYGIKL